MNSANSSVTPMDFDCKEKEVDPSLYRSLVGNLMYLTATRPNLAYFVSILSRFMESPKTSHWEAGKKILKYVKGTLNHGIVYTKTEDFRLVGFSDSFFTC
ncbi:hypothetical protein LXL04_023115 [Taraxacum kok-saghyz]